MNKYIELTKNNGLKFYILKDLILQIHEYIPEEEHKLVMSLPIKNITSDKCNSYIVVKSQIIAFNGAIKDTEIFKVIEHTQLIVNMLQDS